MNELWLEKLTWTLAEIEKLQGRYPGDETILSSINQVRYLIDLARGVVQDDTRLEEIILGHHAWYSLVDIVSYDLRTAMVDISEHVRRQLRRQGRSLNTNRRQLRPGGPNSQGP
jgi:hypothetical protein